MTEPGGPASADPIPPPRGWPRSRGSDRRAAGPGALGRAIRDASIQRKLLVAPALAVLALALVCGLGLRGHDAATRGDDTVAWLTGHQLRESSDALLLAATLQADMFRVTTMVLMGAGRPPPAMTDAIARHERDLEAAVASLAAQTADPAAAARLRAAMAEYHARGAAGASSGPRPPGGDATTSRDAAMALDGVIAAVGVAQRRALAAVRAAQAEGRALRESQRSWILLVLALGGPGLIAMSLLIARRVAEPIRQLTASMTRLAERHPADATPAVDIPAIDIPAVERRDEIGMMARAVLVFRDAMLRADELAREQRATQGFLDTVLEHVPATILVKDADTLRYRLVNRAAEICLGLSRREMLGRHVRDLARPEGAERVQSRDMEALRSGRVTVFEAETIETHSNGQRIATVTRLVIPGPGGEPEYLLTMMEDITERRRAEQRIAYMAHHDMLTDLPNRVLFGERLAEAVTQARLDGDLIAVLALDIDHFKDVNDTLGPAVGDAVLRGVATRLRGLLRGGDMLARLGGDEFAVLLCGVQGAREAEALAERLIEATSRAFQVEGQQVFIGLSVGIGLSEPTLNPTELTQRADLALYDAKRAGRACWRSFVSDMTERLRQRRGLEAALRAAMGTSQLTLHYQPQVDLRDGSIVGGEALLRWASPDHGDIPPGVFIPIAEETGLIGPLGAWLLDLACHEAARWPSRLRVAVNVSPVQVRLPGFLAMVRDALRASGLAPHRLELEVTEGILLHDTDATLAIFTELRALGVLLALDDFGTGYASLAYLRKFRFDKIKIDRSFVRNLEDGSNACAIVRAVVELSRSLGMRSNAEGVETEDEAAILRGLGCTEAQGYLFWRPMAAEAMRTAATASEAARGMPEAAM